MKKLKKITEDEVIQMAEDIIEEHAEYIDECRRWGYQCRFCGSFSPEHEGVKGIKHKEGCSFLIAKKILKDYKEVTGYGFATEVLE